MSIVYEFKDSLYINLTNRCTNACTYCIKYKWDGSFMGNDLRLEKEPSSEEVIAAIGDPARYREIIFCGYGEPLIPLEVLKTVARSVKERGGKVRVNTAGHANLFHKRNILPDLAGLVDAISISLNAADAEAYVAINRPQFGEAAFREVIDFARESKKSIPDVTITAVALPGLDTARVERIAREQGVSFRLRPYLDDEDNQP